jgi:hypothetical protein
MHRGYLLILVTTLAASSAARAQDRAAPSLKGDSRVSVQAGWRYAANSTLYNAWYSSPDNADLPESSRSFGGPLIVGTFAYSVTDLVELGIDLFATGERMQLTGLPTLTTASYGALVGLRFQGWLDLGPEGTVPYLGILTGPLLATAAFKGLPPKETLAQAWVGTVGATMRLNPTWGLNVELRQVFARGATGRADLGSFNAGGSWLSLGVTYFFPKDQGRRLGEGI